MNRDVTIRIPKGSSIRQKVRSIYTDLHIRWRQANPYSTSYPVSRLRQNIRNALSIHGKVFKEERFAQSRYNKWGNGIVIYYSHFYWLVNFRQDRKGNIIADIVDTCYEGDYHNDTMNTRPYGESRLKDLNKNIITEQTENSMKTKKKVVRLTESDLHTLIETAVKEALNELDPRTYANAEREALRRTNSVGDKNYERINKFRQAAINAWNEEYGEEWDDDFPTRFGIGQDKGKKSLHYDGDNGEYIPTIERSIWKPNSHDNDDVFSNIHTIERGNGTKVARQMTKGNGTYIKGKGWQ